MSFNNGMFPGNLEYSCDWIGLRENIQETIDFPMKYEDFPVNVP